MGFEGLAPSYATVSQPTYYACDYLVNYIAWRLRLNLIIVANVENIYFTSDNPSSPYIIIAYLEAKQHFEPISRVQDGLDLSGNSGFISIYKHIYGCLGVKESLGELSTKSARQSSMDVQGIFGGDDPIVKTLRSVGSTERLD